MSKNLLQIDVSSPNKEEDLIHIKISDEESISVNFCKLVKRSTYIRDKYKYSEAIDFLQPEITEIQNKYHIKEDSIKWFIQLIQAEKVSIPIESYKDIYTLSEHFKIHTFTQILDKISRETLFHDLNFTIQILQDSETSNNDIETKKNKEIENFLSERINECFKNSKFKKLSTSTVYRIIEKNKRKIDHNLLLDFILESVDNHIILFKFIEIDKLVPDKVEELIEFIDAQEKTTKQMYLEFMPFNLSFIKNMNNKYDNLLKEMKQTKREIEDMKTKYDQTKRELNETKIKNEQINEDHKQTVSKFEQAKQEFEDMKTKYDQTKQELNETKIKNEQINEDHKQTISKFEQTKQEMNQIKIQYKQINEEHKHTVSKFEQQERELNQTKQELEKFKSELKRANDLLNRTRKENKQYKQTIIVCGDDRTNRLGEKPNNKDKLGDPIISPPIKSSLDPSSLLSYSVYCGHTVVVTRDGSLKGVGENRNGEISSTLQKTVIDHFTDFCIKDISGRQLTAVSAVCSLYGTLYMFSKSSGNERQLVLCDKDINEGDPIFLDIGNHHPVSLFGGRSHSAAIGSEGEIIFINRNSVKNSPNSPISSVSLPNGEKASSVACCDDSVVVLSSNGRVFTSPIKSNGVLNFSSVSELSDQEIICVSGIHSHFLAVNKEGRVFGLGSNKNGRLGLGKGTESVSSFTEIKSLSGYKIKAAYAGHCHSLFKTNENKILSCGFNTSGELLLSSGPSEDVYSPTETTITEDASFCFAGSSLSAVFIGDPPPNTPNMRI